MKRIQDKIKDLVEPQSFEQVGNWNFRKPLDHLGQCCTQISGNDIIVPMRTTLRFGDNLVYNLKFQQILRSQFQRFSRFGAFVSALSSRPVHGLLQVICGQNPERNRHTRIQAHPIQSLGRSSGHIIEMRRVPANHRSESDDCIAAPEPVEAAA